ncbi:zinc finger protein [Cinnamomum micranthum f. kanehirae]|uniref:Zinc finger protein n=1 Tax=Cinnamomum micranthum f. kanehirae TaxID=337451 RepID=A0A443N6Y7_9MAGN|nr:zinc finger protein [Cinnamomum micranthum f. kanehirae]
MCGNNCPCMMSKISGSSTDVKQNELGPDYLGYYKHEIVELFSQNENLLSPSTSKGSESSMKTCAKVEVEDANYHSCNNREAKGYSGSVSVFKDGIGEGLSDFKKEKLKASLKESVQALNHEVDEVVDQILVMHKVRTRQAERNQSYCCSGGFDKETSRRLCKKQKISSATVSNGIGRDVGSGLQSSGGVSKDFQALLETNGLQSEEALRRSSGDLLTKLEHMEQHLEEFLDAVMSRCRAMTHIEKQLLCKRIQRLPAKALDRVVEIVKHRKLSERHACDELHVDLEEEDNVTLWRLHYYVEAVEIANDLK